MSETKPNPPPALRTFTTSAPIKACRLRREDLARLYRIINDRQTEYGQTFVNQVLAQTPAELSEEFQERKDRVANEFVTTVNVTGSYGGAPDRADDAGSKGATRIGSGGAGAG